MLPTTVLWQGGAILKSSSSSDPVGSMTTVSVGSCVNVSAFAPLSGFGTLSALCLALLGVQAITASSRTILFKLSL